MMASKRKRSDVEVLAVGTTPTITGSQSTRTFKSAKEIKDAILSCSSTSLSSVNQQLRIPFSRLPVPISHANVVLAQNYLALDPTLNEVLRAWKRASGISSLEGASHAGSNNKEPADKALLISTIHLLSTFLTLLSPIPYFSPQLTAILDIILSSSEPYSGMLMTLVTANDQPLAQLGMLLLSSMAHVERKSRSSATYTSVGRINVRIWSMFIQGGGIKVLPKLLSMRRKGASAPHSAGSDPLDRPDIRQLTLHFLSPFLSYPLFLSSSDKIVKPLFSNLSLDAPATIFRFFNDLWAALNSGISESMNRKTAISLLNEGSVESILKLYERNDSEDENDVVPRGSKTQGEQDKGMTVADVAHHFLLGVCTKPGTGICFPDQGWYKRKMKGGEEGGAEGADNNEQGQNAANENTTDSRLTSNRGAVHNRILQRVLRTIGAKVVEDERLGAFVVAVLKACPELVMGYWPHSGLSVDPKLSAKWIATISFVGKIVSLPMPNKRTFYIQLQLQSTAESAEGIVDEVIPKSQPPPLTNMIESIFPSPLLKAHLSKGLLDSIGLIQHLSALTLIRSLQKFATVQNFFQRVITDAGDDLGISDPWNQRLRELNWEARKRVPEVAVIIAFAQRAAQAHHSLLTESALHLFGLFYATLPSLVGEIKFDVGRLLVGSSSAKAEARARKAAKEGSVNNEDDDDEVASIGTVGTAGMGGGFGQSRGDLDQFDALSQIHVLNLLGAATTWDWSHKAGGSAYSYFYHLVQLYLGTNHGHTRHLTGDVLGKKLGATLVFDHDPEELDLWLESLPQTRNPAVSASAALQTEQLHLLSFLDDCMRRVLQRPYVYIEKGLEIARSVTPSPLLFACIEQFQAKVSQHLLSNEAALVILRYIRLVVTGLGYKLDGKYKDSLVQSLKTVLTTAEEKRGDELIDLRNQLGLLENGQAVAVRHVEGEDELENLRRRWIDGGVVEDAVAFKQLANSLPVETASNALQHISLDVYVPVITEQRHSNTRLRRIVAVHLRTMLDGDKTARDGSAAVLAAVLSSNPAFIPGLLDDCIPYLTSAGSRHLQLIKAIGQYLLKADSHHLVVIRSTLNAVQDVAIMQAWLDIANERLSGAWLSVLSQKNIPVQRELAERLLAKASPESIINNLEYLRSSNLVSLATKVLNSRTDRVAETVGDLESPQARRQITVQTDVTKLFKNVDFLAAAILISPVIARSSWKHRAELKWSIDSIAVVQAWQSRGFDITGFFQSQPAFAEAMVQGALAQGMDDFVESIWEQLTVELKSKARRVAVDKLSLTPSRIRLLEKIGAITEALERITILLTKMLSANDMLTTDMETSLNAVAGVVNKLEEKPIASHWVETLFTIISQDHFRNVPVLELARALTLKTELKGSSLRQYLQLLVSPDRLNVISRSASVLPAFVGWLHALFLASIYVSCQPAFLQPLLQLYKGTTTLPDQQILYILLAAERQTRSSLSSLLLLWDPSHALNEPQKPIDLVSKLDSRLVFASCLAFDNRRSIEVGKESAGYDPVFALGVLNLALESGLTGLDWVELLRSNLLAVAVCALSSRKAEMRASGGHVLAKALAAIKESFFQEKTALLRLLRLIRHTHTSRLPTMISLFFAHALRTLGDPSSFLYPIISGFLLRRPSVDVHDVPLLYEMLYAPGTDGRRSRRWIVRLIRDGCRSSGDWRVLRRRHTFALLASIFNSSVDRTLNLNILQAIRSMVAVPNGAKHLVELEGLIGWLGMCLESGKITTKEDRVVVLEILELVKPTCEVVDRLAIDADLAELSRLCQVALQHKLSLSLPVLSRRLFQLDSKLPMELAKKSDDWKMAVSALVRIAIAKEPSEEASRLISRGLVLDGPVGDWLRSEAMRV